MSQQPQVRPADTDSRPVQRAAAEPNLFTRRIAGTGWRGWLLGGLIALGLPRTLLTDIGTIPPEGSGTYYVLALTPFVLWLTVAVLHRTHTPLKDHLLAGALYGLSLIIVHEALWAAGASRGHYPPEGAASLAGRFDSPLRELVLHGYTYMIAMMIGLGVGMTAALVAVVANHVRTRLATTQHQTDPLPTHGWQHKPEQPRLAPHQREH